MSNRCRAFLLAVFSLVLTLISSPHFAVAQAPQPGGEPCEDCRDLDYKKFEGGFIICAENGGVVPCKRDKPDEPNNKELDLGKPSDHDDKEHGATEADLKANGDEINNLVKTIKDKNAKQQDRDAAKNKLKEILNKPISPYMDICHVAVQRTYPCQQASKACRVNGRGGKCGNLYDKASLPHVDAFEVESVELSKDNKIIANCTFPANYCRCYLADLMADVGVAYETRERELSTVFFGE